MAGSTKPDYGLQNVNIAFQVLCPALALIVTTLRVYSRLNTKTFGWGMCESRRSACPECSSHALRGSHWMAEAARDMFRDGRN